MMVEPIGRVTSSRTQAFDDGWGSVTATIHLDSEQFNVDVLAGLGEFSHIEVIFVFDGVDPDDVENGARHPRGNTAWPRVGIFAQRAKMRPNRLGVSVCTLLGIDGLTLAVQGLDAIDGTPVLDIKPFMAEFGPRGDVHQPTWSRELMAGYWVGGAVPPR